MDDVRPMNDEMPMNKVLKTLIVDDEPLARKGLAVRIKQFPQIEVVEQCHNGNQAIEAVTTHQPDLMFLDIQMPGLNGFQVIQRLQELDLPLPMIVFVTAFDQYAIKAFDVHAIDYVLKPVDERRLGRAVDKVLATVTDHQDRHHKERLVQLVSDVTGTDCEQILKQLANEQPVAVSAYSPVLVIKDGAELTRVATDNIIWIDAAGDYMIVHTPEGTHILRKTMKELETELDPKMFIRNHRSSIVNKSFVEKFCSQVSGEHSLILTNGQSLKVSRSYRDKVKKSVLNQ